MLIVCCVVIERWGSKMAKEIFLSSGKLATICHMTKHTILSAIERGELEASKTPGGHNRIHILNAIEFMKKYNIPVDEIQNRIRKSVLIVDDESFVREILTEILGTDNFHIETAASGYEAGKLAERLRPDLVLLDLLLPDIDGREICKQIKADKKTDHAKTIAITGLRENIDVNELKAIGFDDVIGKPFDIPRLKDVVYTMLNIQTIC